MEEAKPEMETSMGLRTGISMAETNRMGWEAQP